MCVPAWCGVCVMLAGGRCVSASAHHRDIAHRDLLSTELSWALVRWRAWVRGAQAAGPVSSPPTLHTPAPTSHQPPATSRDWQEIWGSVEVARVLIMQLLSQHRPLPPSAGACRVEAQYNTVNGEPTNVPALDAVVTRG